MEVSYKPRWKYLGDGNRVWVSRIDLMVEYAKETSKNNGHPELEVIVDGQWERAVYCPGCGQWGHVASGPPEDKGMSGTAIFGQCEEVGNGVA